MAKKYGINFPFRDSSVGDFFNMTVTPEKEIRTNMIHLILTRKGSRYYMPDFGTRIYDYIFDMNDNTTYEQISSEIRESVRKYIPNVEITNLTVENAENDLEEISTQQIEDERLFRVSGDSEKPYTAKVKIEYSINSSSFSSSDFIIINI